MAVGVTGVASPGTEGPLLLIQEDHDVSGDLRFVVRKTTYSLCWNNIMHTEVDVPCYTTHEFISVLSM